MDADKTQMLLTALLLLQWESTNTKTKQPVYNRGKQDQKVRKYSAEDIHYLVSTVPDTCLHSCPPLHLVVPFFHEACEQKKCSHLPKIGFQNLQFKYT